MDVMSISVCDLKENGSQQRSAGKRSREKTIDMFNTKRPALACLSNHIDNMTETRQQQKSSKPCYEVVGHNSVFTQSSISSSLSCLDTPVASPMIVSSLECCEVTLSDHTDCHVEYTSEIFTYLREAELRCQPRVGYMLKQPDITSSMRSVLVDWLVEVVDEFTLQPKTLYLAVSIIDRFLSHMSVLRGKLQLVGSTAMYIAAKIEEIYPPEISDFAYITDNTYTQQQIVRMEKLILQSLDYHILAPSSLCFLEYYLAIGCPGNEDTPVHLLAKYLCELALVHSDPFLKYLPSQIATSSLCLARHTLELEPSWPSNLHNCTGYNTSDVGHCLQDMHRMFAMATNQSQQAIRLKYCSDKYMRVALLKVSETIPM